MLQRSLKIGLLLFADLLKGAFPIRDTVSLWRMLEHRHIAGFEGKYRRFRNSSEFLKTLSVETNWPIWTQKVPKKRKDDDVGNQLLYVVQYMNGGLTKISSLYTYVIHRTFYFERYCTTVQLTFVLLSSTAEILSVNHPWTPLWMTDFWCTYFPKETIFK